MTVWFWGTQSWFHPCLQYTQFLPNLTTCLCRRLMSKSGATWKTALLAPCLVCSKPHKLPSALLILSLRIGIALSCTGRRLSHNCRGLARRLGRLLQLVARSNFRIFFIIDVVPFFKQCVCNQVAESDWLYWFVLLESVQVDFLLHQCWKCLNVSSQTSQAHNQVVLVLKYSLIVVCYCEELLAESSIAGDSHAVFSDHTDQCASVIFVNGHFRF